MEDDPSQAWSTRASDAARAQAAACEVIASSDAAKGQGKRHAGKCGQGAYGEAWGTGDGARAIASSDAAKG